MIDPERILFIGHLRPALADDALREMRCADKDAAFALIDESTLDVFGLEDDFAAAADAAAHRSDGTAADPVEAQVRLMFHCQNEEDRQWLHLACTEQPQGVGLAWAEIDTAERRAACVIRVADGVRVVEITPAG